MSPTIKTANSLSPEERAKMEAQNANLKTMLQNAKKLPYDATDIRVPSPLRAGVDISRVSWIAAGKNGLIYFIQRDPNMDPIVAVDGNGTIVRTWGTSMYTMPHAIRVDPQGNVWTTDAASSMVYKFSPEGKTLMQIEVGGQPSPCRGNFCSTTDVAFAPNGHLFISDGYRNARILEYLPDGTKVREWGSAGTGPGQFNLPHSIQIDENGIIYVADRENGRIQRFDQTGTFLGEWSQYGKTFGLKLDQDAIWLSSIPRGPNTATGWLIKLDKKTGNLLGYVDSKAIHAMDVLPSGDLLSASPGKDELPQWFKAVRPR